MKITKHQLKQIIKEELEAVLAEEILLDEGWRDTLKKGVAGGALAMGLMGAPNVASAKAPAAQTQVDPEAARAQYADLEPLIRGHLDPEVYERMGDKIRDQLLDWLVEKYPDPSVIAPDTARWSSVYSQISRYLQNLNDKGSAELARQ